MKICFIGSMNIFIYNFAKYYVEKKGFEVFLISRKKSNWSQDSTRLVALYQDIAK